MKINAYCLGHKDPIFNVPIDYTLVAPHEIFKHEYSLIIEDDKYGDSFHGSILSEYTQLIGLVEHFKKIESDPETFVFLFQYRKFLSLNKEIPKSQNIPYASSLNSSLAPTVFPSVDALIKMTPSFLLGPAVNVGTYSMNYAKHHISNDFTCFVLAMRACGFEDDLCFRFVNCPILFPAPALGLYKIEFLIYLVETLKKVWAFHYNNFFIKREGYQRRVGGFLLERLHSFIIYESIRSKKIVNYATGSQVVVSESSVIIPTL